MSNINTIQPWNSTRIKRSTSRSGTQSARGSCPATSSRRTGYHPSGNITAEGVIYNKRGIGYFITPEAKDIVLENSRKEFLETELPAVVRKMELLGLNPSELFGNK